MREIGDKFTAALRHDPKRTAVLVLLLLALGVSVWRQVARGPAKAQAVSQEEQAASEGATAAPDIHRAAALVAKWKSEPVPHLSRNLFASDVVKPSSDNYSPPRAAGTASEADGLFWRQLEQALASRADREQYRQMLTDALLKDAAALPLTSIVVGPQSRAMIGAKLLQVGDEIGGGARGPLTLVEIDPKRAVLARDGLRVVLTLGKADAELLEAE